jgi:hypothetical protein
MTDKLLKLRRHQKAAKASDAGQPYQETAEKAWSNGQ